MRKLIAIVFFLSMLSLFSLSVFALEYNPGCDSTVVSSGVDLVTAQNYVGANRVLVTKGAKWWLYDSTAYWWSGGFIDAGEDLATFLKDKAYYNGVYTPDCFNNGSLELNPGCDADVNASGIDALFDSFLNDPTYQALITKDNKWWEYDVRLNNWRGGYNRSGDNISLLFVTREPVCGSGPFQLNPGCDENVTADGIDILTTANIVGSNEILLTKGVKWWVYDTTAYGGEGGFIDGSDDLATFLKDKAYYNGVYTPDCFNNGSLELNPGCDFDVNLEGVNTISDNFLGEPSYQTLITKGTKWWVYDTRAGTSGGYIDAGDNVSSLFFAHLPECNVTLCEKDSDCGADGYVGVYFCMNGDVYRDHRSYECVNPGTGSSKCQETTVPVLIDECGANENCVDGSSTCQSKLCLDGTAYGQCSYTKPEYCKDGTLIDNCSYCGCPPGGECQANNSCTAIACDQCAGSCGPCREYQCVDYSCVCSIVAECCGNDICESNETYTENQETCCADCGCPVGEVCYNNTCYEEGTEPPAVPPIEEEIEQRIKELTETTQEEANLSADLSKVIKNLELIKADVTNPDHKSRLDDIEARILEILESIESFERQNKKDLVYQIKWFFGLVVKQEKREAEFYDTKSRELWIISDDLKSLAEEMGRGRIRDLTVGEVASLRVHSNRLEIKAGDKRRGAWGIFSLFVSIFNWIAKLFSRK